MTKRLFTLAIMTILALTAWADVTLTGRTATNELFRLERQGDHAKYFISGGSFLRSSQLGAAYTGDGSELINTWQINAVDRYIGFTLPSGISFKEGDVITITGGLKSTGTTKGFKLTDATSDATFTQNVNLGGDYTTAYSKTSLSYTIQSGDGIIGKGSLYIYRNGENAYVEKVVVTRTGADDLVPNAVSNKTWDFATLFSSTSDDSSFESSIVNDDLHYAKSTNVKASGSSKYPRFTSEVSNNLDFTTMEKGVAFMLASGKGIVTVYQISENTPRFYTKSGASATQLTFTAGSKDNETGLTPHYYTYNTSYDMPISVVRGGGGNTYISKIVVAPESVTTPTIVKTGTNEYTVTPGTSNGGPAVTVSTYYTTDGTTPTSSSTVLLNDGKIAITDGMTQIQVISISDFDAQSAVASQSVSFEPETTDISSATVTLSQNSFPYTGEAQAPSVTSVVLNEVTLNAETDYDINTITSQTNIGNEYTVSVTGKGNYTGTATATWAITRGEGSISFANTSGSVAMGTTDFSVVVTKVGDGTVTYSSGDTNIATIDESSGLVTPVSAGITTITATVANGTNYDYATTTATYELTVTGSSTPKTKVPVILTAGQSNTDGRAMNDSLPYYIKNQVNSVYPNVYWSYGNATNDKVTGTFDNYWPACDASPNTRWAYDAVVYYHLQKTLNGTPLYVIKESKGNTAINTACSSTNDMYWSADATWLEGKTSADSEGKSLLLAFIDNIDKCITTLENEDKEADIKFLMWHQGEADRGQGAAYQTQLQQVINYIRNYLVTRTGNNNYTNLPVILGGIKSSTAQYNSNVEAGKQAIAEADENIYYVSSEDFPVNAYRQDNLHFNFKGAEMFGKRVYDLIATNDLLGDYANTYATKENNIYPPTISFNEENKQVTITRDANSDIEGNIYYTTDETTPTTSSTAYSAPFIATQTGTVKAVCISDDITSYASEKNVAVPSAPVVYDFAAAKTNNETFTVNKETTAKRTVYYYTIGEDDKKDTNYGFYPVTSNTNNMPINGRISWKAGNGKLAVGGMTNDGNTRYFAIHNLYADDKIIINFNGTIKYAKHSTIGDAITGLSTGNELASGQEYTIASTEETNNYVVFFPADGTIISQIYINREKYALTFADTVNGTLTVNNGDTSVESGATFFNGTSLTVTATANEGYELDALTVNGTAVEASDITESPEKTYTYTLSMPSEATVIAATFKAETIVKSESVVYDFAEGGFTQSSDTKSSVTYLYGTDGTKTSGVYYIAQNNTKTRLSILKDKGNFGEEGFNMVDGNRAIIVDELKKKDIIRIIYTASDNNSIINGNAPETGATLTGIETRGNIESGKEIEVASLANDYAAFTLPSNNIVISQIAINKGIKPRVVYDSYDETNNKFTYNISFYEGEVLHYKLDDGEETIVNYTAENNGTVSVSVGTGNLICWTTYDEVASDEVTTKVALPQVPEVTLKTDGTETKVYTVTFLEGETLHYTLPCKTEENTIEYSTENNGSVDITVNANGDLVCWTTIGSLTSSQKTTEVEGIVIDDEPTTAATDVLDFRQWIATNGSDNYESFSIDENNILSNPVIDNKLMDLHGLLTVSDVTNLKIRYNSSATNDNAGLWMANSKNTILTIKNLKAKDNITIESGAGEVYYAVRLTSTNAHKKGTGITPANDGSTVWTSGDTWVMDEDGDLTLKFGDAANTYIHCITITSHETVTAGVVTVDETNPNKITISKGATDSEGATIVTYYSMDGTEPTTIMEGNLEQEMSANATIRTLTKSSTGKTASSIYAFTYQEPSASVAIDFQDAAEAEESLSFATETTDVWEYADEDNPDKKRSDYYLLTNNSNNLPISGKVSWRDPKGSKPTLESTGIKSNGYPFAIHDLAKNDEIIIVHSGTLTNVTATSGNTFSIGGTTVDANGAIASESTIKVTSVGTHNSIVLKPDNNTVISAIYINHEVVVKPEKVSTPTIALRSGYTNRATITSGVSSYGNNVTTYYTTDGTEPTTESTSFTDNSKNLGPYTQKVTIKAVSISETGLASAITSFVLDPQKFTITLPSNLEGGTVTANKETATEGETVKLTITPADGYYLAQLIADNGVTIDVNNNFKMPAANVTISATFVKKTAENANAIVTEDVKVVDETHATITSVEPESLTETTTVAVSGTVNNVPVTAIENGAFASLQGSNVQSVDLSSTQVALEGERSTNSVLKDIPENTLVYLPCTSSNVTGNNVIIYDGEGTAASDYTCNNFVMTDTKSYSVPQPFTATNATLSRSFTSGVTCTVCLPYDVPAGNLDGNIYQFSEVNGTTVKMTQKEGGLVANTPYIFVPSGNVTQITATSVTINMSGTPNTSPDGQSFTFKGVFEHKDFTTDEISDGIYGFAADANHGALSVGQFVKASNGAWTKGMRAYLAYSGSLSETEVASTRGEGLPDVLNVVLIHANGSTTNIGSLELMTADDGSPVYNLNGQRVDNSYKGLVIKNGKKVVKK